MPHTPGPWRLAKVVGPKAFSAGGEQVYRIDARTTLDIVVAPFSDGYVLGENEANAKLIAAAPDMLRALNLAKYILDANRRAIPLGGMDVEYQAICDAIDKATIT